MALLSGTLAVLLAVIASPAMAQRQADSRGHWHGVTLRSPVHASRTAAVSAAEPNTGNLVFHGGSVMHSNHTHVIYWDPGSAVPSAYKTAINTFLGNVAADNGKPTNVYGLTAQYSDAGGSATYASSFAGALVDTNGYPANGCTPHSKSRPTCLSDSQIQTELGDFISANGLPKGLGEAYFVFTPESVETCIDGGSQCSSNVYCAYHSNFTLGGKDVLYADDPYPDGGCPLSSYPNGPGTAADEAINTLSHEHIETITDPLGDGWFDASGLEIGDKCNRTFGPLLGSSGNEAIGTGSYMLQEEWSNAAGLCAATADPPPVPSLALSATSAVTGQLISADASASSEPDGTIATYRIDWGDGTAADGVRQTHAYSRPGSFTVTLTVTDNDGSTAASRRAIVVTQAPPPPPSCSPASTATGVGVPVLVGLGCTGDAVTRFVMVGPAHGTLGMIDQVAGTVTYTPAPGFTGTDSFAYKGIDSQGASSATQVVTITVGGARASAAPTLGALRLSRTLLKLGTHGVRPGPALTYTVTGPGVTTFFVERSTAGVRHGQRCIRGARLHGARCRLFARLRGSARHNDGAGTTTVSLASLLRKFSLAPGDYRLVAVFRPAAAGASSTASAQFRLTR